MAKLITHGMCGKSWTGQTRCHCAGCHETFSCLTAFDFHQRGGVCNTPNHIGMVPRHMSWGLMWTTGGDNPFALLREMDDAA